MLYGYQIQLLWITLAVIGVCKTTLDVTTKADKITLIRAALNLTSRDKQYLHGTNVTVTDACSYLMTLTGVKQIAPEELSAWNSSYCGITWDGVQCWPSALAGSLVIQPCLEVFQDLELVKSNSTKQCDKNGTWSNFSNYSLCIKKEQYWASVIDSIYLAGFVISTTALVIAMAIFICFRKLRCVRNAIHCHLIMSYILKNVFYITLTFVIRKAMETQTASLLYLCKAVLVGLNYFTETNFFWMFVEGLYLHTLIIWAYTAEKMRIWHYCLIGWAFPLLFILSWMVVKIKYENNACWEPTDTSNYDRIIMYPILVVLGLNGIFLATIIYVLATKIRAPNALESNQYWKIVKATLVLVPLLGVTYIIFITPIGSSQTALSVYNYANAITQSLQGFVVALFYCFLNGEVQACIKNRIQSWNESRNIGCRTTRNTSLAFMGRSSNGDVTRVIQMEEFPRQDGGRENDNML